MRPTKQDKLKKKKFRRNAIIGLISLAIVAYILNLTPGYEKDNYADKINLIINSENITSELQKDVYINANKVVYLSWQDVTNLLDSNLYYDEKHNQIITTSETKVATIVIGKREMVVNDTEVKLQDPIIKKNGIIYIPISEMELVYNIEVTTTENIVVIVELGTGQILATVKENTDLKYKQRGLSKTVAKLEKGERVSVFDAEKKGWKKIRKATGEVGYIKASKLTNTSVIRQDNETFKEAKSINIDYANNSNWSNITDDTFNGEPLSDYEIRKQIANKITKLVMDENKTGINIDCRNIDNSEYFMRMLIELTPKLREIGITTSVVINNGMDKDMIKSIVDYVI